MPGPTGELPVSAGVPIVFGPADRPLTGFFQPASGSSTRPLAVVLCNPLGFEEASVHRTYRHLAARLAAAGIATLRFDHEGTGNSPMASGAPGRVAAWIAGIQAAAKEVRALAGVERVALVGVRFGASLATLAAAELRGIDGLVLWAPIVSGRAHARELRAFRLIKGPKSGPGRLDGGEEIGGHFFAKETLDAMAGVDLLAFRVPPAARALILARNERSADERKLVEHLSALGVKAESGLDAGYTRMMRDDPYEAIVPIETLEAIVEWLAQGSAPQPRSARAPPIPPTFAVPSRGSGPDLREAPVVFGDEGRLFGIITAPAQPSAVPAVFFVNVGANHLAAPHRINVELAREVASLGHLALRFDLSGLGDSGCAPNSPEGRLYTLDAVADVQQAMDLVAELHGVRSFILVGLCSGAYVAFHAAVQDARVVGQVLLSPYAFEWKEGDPVAPTERQHFQAFQSSRFYMRAIFEPRTWLRMARGEIQVKSIATVLGQRARDRLEGAIDSVFDQLRPGGRARSPVERAFKDLSDRGVASLLVAGFEDGGLDTVSKYLGTDAKRMRGRKNFSLEVLNDVDHTFTTSDSRSRLLEILKRYLAASAGEKVEELSAV